MQHNGLLTNNSEITDKRQNDWKNQQIIIIAQYRHVKCTTLIKQSSNWYGNKRSEFKVQRIITSGTNMCDEMLIIC